MPPLYKPLDSVTLLRVACLGLVVLGAPDLASARGTASLSLTGYLTICGVDTPLLNESSPVSVSDGLGPVTMDCGDNSTNTGSMHAQARAHPDSAPDIAVVVSSTGPGANATAEANFDDFATLSPPLGLIDLDVTFSITSAYSLSLSLPTGDSSGIALVQLTIPLYAFVDRQLADGGDLSGTLDTGDITISNCNYCTIEILGTVSVRGANGGGGSAKDPFTINLPEGWTYTLASEQQAPEPSSLAMGGSALAAVRVVRSWRVRRTRSPSRSLRVQRAPALGSSPTTF